MEPAAVGRFYAAGRSAVVSPVVTRADLEAPGGARRRCLIEMQWRDSGGRFRHLAVRPPGLRRVMATLGVFVLLGFAFGVAGTFTAEAKRPLAHFGVGAILNEHAGLKARHADLRERAFDLAEQLYSCRVEQARRTVRRTAAADGTSEGRCPRPPARDAGDESIFLWLAEHGTRLEAMVDEPTAGRAETGVTRASAQAPTRARTVATGNAGAIRVADDGRAHRVRVVLGANQF